MKHILSLSVIFFIATSCNQDHKRGRRDILINAIDTIMMNKGNDSVYAIQKSPNERHVFKVNANHGDTVIVENKSK